MIYNNKPKQEPIFDFYGRSYINFENDFMKYSALILPLTFLTDDIMKTMVAMDTNYFILNKENCELRRNVKFNFEIKDNVYYFTHSEIIWTVRKSDKKQTIGRNFNGDW